MRHLHSYNKLCWLLFTMANILLGSLSVHYNPLLPCLLPCLLWNSAVPPTMGLAMWLVSAIECGGVMVFHPVLIQSLRGIIYLPVKSCAPVIYLEKSVSLVITAPSGWVPERWQGDHIWNWTGGLEASLTQSTPIKVGSNTAYQQLCEQSLFAFISHWDLEVVFTEKKKG